MRGEDRGRRMRRLSESERALWRKVQRSVRPLHGPPSPPLPPEPTADAGAPGRAAESGTAPAAPSPAKSSPASRAGSAKQGDAQPPAARRGTAGTVAPQPPAGAAGLSPAPPRLSPSPSLAPAPATASLSDIDRKTRRGLARGSVPVEARLDLHGLTQADAYRELRRFLVDAQARGLRHVLVITGKGRRPNDTGEGGVLRRAVPEWLRQPELRPYVAMVGAAAAGHGGDGALYLRLARPVRPRRR